MKRSRFHAKEESKEDISQYEDYMSINIAEIERKEKFCKKINAPNNEIKPMLVRMADSRQKGLEEPLSKQSKGFKLLKIFGYDGQGGLGRDNSGITEPIKTVFKEQKRAGLGIEEKINRMRQTNLLIREERKKLSDDLTAEFCRRRQELDRQRKIKIRLESCEKLIEKIDRDHFVERHILWPADEIHCSEETTHDCSVDFRDSELSFFDSFESRLYRSESYLRDSYFYCANCGCQYESFEDMEDNCPGEVL